MNLKLNPPSPSPSPHSAKSIDCSNSSNLSSSSNSEAHLYYLDYLRIIAIFSVVVFHTPGASLFSFEYAGVFRWGVDLFFMISGASFLSKSTIDIRKILTKNIPRLAIAYILCSLLFLVIKVVIAGFDFTIDLLIMGEGHLWFISVLIGIYLIVPVLHDAFHNNFALLKYFVIVYLIVEMTFCLFRLIAFDFFDYNIPERSLINFTLGISSYTAIFIFGYFLANLEIKLRTRNLILLFFISEFCLVYIGSQESPGISFTNLRPLEILNAACLFLIFKKLRITNQPNKFWLNLSSLSFGIYLFHLIPLELGKRIPLFFQQIENSDIQSIFYKFTLSLAAYIISAIITYICKQIPGLKKIL